MNKNKMQSKLEKLYEAQEKYFKLLEEFQKEIRQIDKPISLWNITGSIDGFGIESVDESMIELERQMKRFGLEWDEEEQEKEDYTL